MSISFKIGICPDCGEEHDPDILHFLLYSGWVEMEDSTDEMPNVGLNPLIVDALFRTNAEYETVEAVERMLFDDTITVFMDMNNDEDDDEPTHNKPILTIVKND